MASAMEIQHFGSASVLRLMERVDSVTCVEVESALQALIATNPPHVICDFAATKYISSAGLRVVMLAAKNLKRAGGQLALVCAKGNYIYEVFDLTAFTHIVPVFETLDEAVAKLHCVPVQLPANCPGTQSNASLKE
jgi:anti-sigma B factor antagonist